MQDCKYSSLFLNKHKFFFIVLLLAFLLRIPAGYWGISFFNPHQKIFHPDEPKTVIAACKFPPHLNVSAHPTFYHYFLGILSLPIKSAIPFGDPDTFMVTYHFVYLLSRFITVLFGAGAVFILYLWGLKRKSNTLALLSAGLLAIASSHVLEPSIATTYVPLSFFLALGFYKLDIIKSNFNYKNCVHLGIISGLIISTKFTGFFFFIPISVYVICSIKQLACGHTREFLCNLVMCCILALFILTLTTPAIFNPGMWKEIAYESGVVRGADYAPYDIRLWKIAFSNLFIAIGIPLGILFLAGIFTPTEKDVSKYAFIAMLSTYFLYFRGGILVRYFVGIMPLLAFFSADVIIKVYQKVRFKKVYLSLISIIMIYSLVYTAGCIFLRINDTRTQAAKFIDIHFKSGTGIALANSSGRPWHYHGWRYPSVDFTKYPYIGEPKKADIIVFTSYDSAKIEDVVDSPDNYLLVESFKKNNWFKAELDSPDVMIYQKLKRDY
jgi:hypothetical protein